MKTRFVTVPKFLDKVRTLLSLFNNRSTEVLESGLVRFCQYLVDEHILGKSSYKTRAILFAVAWQQPAS